MIHAHVAPACLEDVHMLAPRLRQPDIDEVWAASKVEPLVALTQSYESARFSYSGFINGQIICMFGVSVPTILSTIGIPWMLGAKEIEEHPKVFLRHSRRVVDGWRRDYDLLVNFVDARNTLAVKWLRWLGFTIHPAEPFGALGLPFHKFEAKGIAHV